jgi:hypothetical protein
LESILHRKGGRQPLAYVHIPKTGGTYIAQLESDRRPVISPIRYLGHTYIVHRDGIPNPLYYPRDPVNAQNVIFLRDAEQYTVVSTVRNVFDWLVSYAWHAGGWNPRYRNPDHHDFEAANKGFGYLVQTVANREDPWPSRRFIHCQLFCSDGALVVDWVNRLESLDTDLAQLAAVTGASYNPKPRQRVGHTTDYREYYSNSIKNLVFDTWGRELQMLGYGFEGSEESSGLLGRAVDGVLNKHLNYLWARDTLTVDGVEIER